MGWEVCECEPALVLTCLAGGRFVILDFEFEEGPDVVDLRALGFLIVEVLEGAMVKKRLVCMMRLIYLASWIG